MLLFCCNIWSGKPELSVSMDLWLLANLRWERPPSDLIIRSNPKVFLGYSDVTVLLQYLERQARIICFHGPMVAREFALGETAFRSDYPFESKGILRIQ